jgi:FtsZ-interacting cell division protein ZipA
VQTGVFGLGDDDTREIERVLNVVGLFALVGLMVAAIPTNRRRVRSLNARPIGSA